MISVSSWRATVALVSAIALFHLTVWWGGSACLMPPVVAMGATTAAATTSPSATVVDEGDEAEDAAHAEHAEHIAHTSSTTDVAGEDLSRGQSPSPARGSHAPSHDEAQGCASAAPCVVAVAAAGRTALPQPNDGMGDALDRRMTALSSVSLAPELPPPRA